MGTVAVNPGWIRTARRGGDSAVGRVAHLTDGQRDMLREFAQGASVRDVAERRGMHPSKVKRHLNAIYRELELERRPMLPIVRAVSLLSTFEERERLGVHLPD